MDFSTSKPKLTSAGLIKKMISEKGITFNIVTRLEAFKFLSERENYLRLASYRKNYAKNKDDKYINLDFGYLMELSELDTCFRNIIMKMTINVEHSMKVKLIKDIEISTEDGYSIVNDFLNKTNNEYVISDINRKSNSQYTGELIKHHFKFTTLQDSSGNKFYKFDLSAWVFFELISFGTFINFYQYYYTKTTTTNKNKVNKQLLLLNSVKSLRNACAHNNCILHNLNPLPKHTKPSGIITNSLKNLTSVGNGQKAKKLTNQFILEFVTLLYVFNDVVPEDVKKDIFKELKYFSDNRLTKNITYFDKNAMLQTSIEFLKKVIDFFAK